MTPSPSCMQVWGGAGGEGGEGGEKGWGGGVVVEWLSGQVDG